MVNRGVLSDTQYKSKQREVVFRNTDFQDIIEDVQKETLDKLE